MYWKDAIILGEKGINVPAKLIFYPDDSKIDFSDISEITDEEWDDVEPVTVMVKKKLYDYTVRNKINLSNLINSAIQTKTQFGHR